MVGGEKKEEKENSGSEDSSCKHASIDMGNGPADWIFEPEKLRELFHHANAKFAKEEEE